MVAAELVERELMEREVAKEKRDREWWAVTLGGEVPEDAGDQVAMDATEQSTLLPSDDELIARSMLARR